MQVELHRRSVGKENRDQEGTQEESGPPNIGGPSSHLSVGRIHRDSYGLAIPSCSLHAYQATRRWTPRFT